MALLEVSNTYSDNKNNNILVIDFQLIGDSVMVTPIFKNIKYNLSDDKTVELLCYERERQIFCRCRYIDKIFAIKRFDDFRKQHNKLPVIAIKFYYWIYLIDFVKKNLVNRYGKIIVPRWDVDTVYSGIIALITNAQERIAYSESVTEAKKKWNCCRDYYFTKVFTHNAACNEVDKYIDLIQLMGFDIVDREIELIYNQIKTFNGIDLSFPYVVFCVDASNEKRE